MPSSVLKIKQSKENVQTAVHCCFTLWKNIIISPTHGEDIDNSGKS
jgi:hypothetical protein